MFTSRLFWKPFVYFSVLIAIVGLIGGLTTSQWQKEQLTDQLQQRLRNTAISLEETVRKTIISDDFQRLHGVIKDISTKTTTRITRKRSMEQYMPTPTKTRKSWKITPTEKSCGQRLVMVKDTACGTAIRSILACFTMQCESNTRTSTGVRSLCLKHD